MDGYRLMLPRLFRCSALRHSHSISLETRLGSSFEGARIREIRETEDMSTKVYVGNLPYSTDEDQLRQLFGADGRNVSDVAIITDRMTGQPRGFAFVQM